MAQTHHHAVGKPSGYLEAVRKAVSIGYKAVIARGREGLGESGKYPFTVVQHR
jgi:hypothetical protein